MDVRVDYIFEKEMRNDTSFSGDTSFSIFGPVKYSKVEIRDAWNSGIKFGIELGLRNASLEGQQLELMYNIDNPKHKEFLEKFYALTAEYNCAIQYNYEKGMVVIAR